MNYVTYLFLLLALSQGLLVCQEIPAVDQSSVQSDSFVGGFDIDQLQQEMVASNIMEQLDTRPPLPPKIMLWLKIIGLPALNTFVAVRKAIRETWYKTMAAFHKLITTQSQHAKKVY